MDSWLPGIIMVFTALLYTFILVPIVFPSARPENDAQKKRLKEGRSAHNLRLALYSLFVCSLTFYYLYEQGELTDWQSYLCSPVEGTWLRPLSVSFTLSKLVEWVDTFYIKTLGKRPPIFLHLYHHATTFWLFMLVTNIPGTEKGGMLLNGGVHTLMYFHYWRPFGKMFVPVITLLQIAQLATVTYMWYAAPIACSDKNWSKGPAEFPLEYIVPYLMVPTYLLFFCIYFVKRFLCKKKDKATDKAAKNKDGKQD